MAKYKAYPEYKDSGVEWLGDIPTHWDCTALKRLCSLITGLTPPTQNEDNYADEGYPWVRPEDLNESGFGTHASKYVSDIGWKLLRHIKPNSTLICCIGTIGKCGYVKETVSTNQQITAATFRDCERFNYYLLQSARAQLEELATGNVLKILNSERLGALNVVKVNRKEANTIAEFLDHETTKIDDLIEKQQQLIELLKEKRQAVISHAVTKGLNPDVPMKDSGVEWLGEIPAHWTIPSLKYNISTRKGVAFKSSDFCDAGIRVVKASDIKKKTIISSDVFLPVCFSKEYPKAVLNFGDIVLSTVGSTPDVKNSAVGQLGYVPAELEGSLLNQNTVVFSSNSNTLEQFYLFLLLQTDIYRDHLDLHAHGTANQASLNVSDMLDFKYPCPSLSEQIEIVDYIQNCNSKFDVLETCSEEAIKYLQERRTALISAAVTGKIDVRDWVAPDTQDVEEPQEATA